MVQNQSKGALQVEWMFKQPGCLELTHNWCAFFSLKVLLHVKDLQLGNAIHLHRARQVNTKPSKQLSESFLMSLEV